MRPTHKQAKSTTTPATAPIVSIPGPVVVAAS
jgi:hypothetical protein